MRHLYAALAILLACLILCLVVVGRLDRYTTRTAETLERAQAAGSSGDFGEAADQVREAFALWDGKKGFFGMALRHNDLDSINEAFCELRAYAEGANEDEFAPACAGLIARIRHIAEMEKPYYYNVL